MTREEADDFLDEIIEMAGERTVAFSFCAIIEGPDIDEDPMDTRFISVYRGGDTMAVGLHQRAIWYIRKKTTGITDEEIP